MAWNTIVAVVVLVAQSCLTFCNPMDCGPSGSSVHVILQARMLEWIAIPFSRKSSQPMVEPGSLALQADCLPLSCQGRVRKVGKLSKIYQFSSFTQLCPTLCDSKDCSTSGLPVHHQLPEFIQTHVPWVSDAIQPSHPLSSPSLPAFNLFQHQGLFKWVSPSHKVAKVLEFRLQHQFFQWIFRTDFL